MTAAPAVPRIGIGVIVLKGGKVLMQRRLGAHGAETWSFPGGHLEFGESWSACAARETLEETGVAIRNVRFAALTNDVFAEEKKHYVTLFMLADWESGEPQLMEPSRTTEIGWFLWEQLPRPLFLPVENLLAQGFRP